MPISRLVLGLVAALPVAVAALSQKRGLVFITNTDSPGDNRLFAPPASGLTWYYNYGVQPSSLYGIIPQETFEFVPNMWGVDSENPTDTSFLGNVTALINGGTKITHVLSFNDPDAGWDVGGCNATPAVAAQAWVANMVPLRKMGVKVSLPSILSSHDLTSWMDPFLANCSQILGQTCEFDFLGLHAYGDMDYLKQRISNFTTTYPGIPIWLLEYALANTGLTPTQQFFNESTAYLDSLDIVERYAWFGSFRSTKSAVGPSVAMLDKNGKLTDLARWYFQQNNTQASTSTPGTNDAMGLRADNLYHIALASLSVIMSLIIQVM